MAHDMKLVEDDPGLWCVLKWSSDTGYQVKDVKSHNEVNNDNRKEDETVVHRRLQT